MIVGVRMVGWVRAGCLALLVSAPAAGDPPAAARAAPASSEGRETAAPPRTKVTCAQYRARVAASAPHAAFDTRLKRQSWGAIPTALHKLPRGAQLCGADSRGQAVVASSLFGKALEAHYAPLFAKLEFDRLDCSVDHAQTVCRTKHGARRRRP